MSHVTTMRNVPVYWPYTLRPKSVTTKGDWKMGMSGGGSMVIWPTKEAFPASLDLIEAFQGTKEELEQFHTTFCKLGYEKDALHEYQDSAVMLFNWVSGTLAQVHIAAQAAKLLFSGEYDKAWEVGRDFEKAMQEAEKIGASDGQSRVESRTSL